MIKTPAVALLAALIMVATLLVPTPASAELGDNNNLPWGVDGTDLPVGTLRIETEVWDIEQIGNTIYTGGRFQQVTDGVTSIPQPYLAAFNATTGQYISGFTPQLDGVVHALAASPDGTKLFVGGEFDNVNGQPIDALVALDPATGATDAAWSGDINGAPSVRTMEVLGNWLYVGGSFGAVVSSTGNNAAFGAIRFDVTTGGHDAGWRPNFSGGSIWGIAPSPDTDRVYAAGYFTSVNGTPVVGGFGAVSSVDGQLVPGLQDITTNTTNSSRQYLYDVVVANGYVWVAGSEHFVQVLNESDLSLHRFHLADPRGDYQDLEVVGDRVYAGCHCRAGATMRSSDARIWFPRPPAGEVDGVTLQEGPTTWVAAFDANNGEWIPGFVPNISAAKAGVWAIHGDSTGCVWFGGDITTAGNQTAEGVIRLCDAGEVDVERPSTPGAARVDGIGADSVDLSWNPSTDNVGVTSYLIFDANTDTVLATSPTESTTLTGLAAGTYSVYLKAEDARGNRSFRSGTRTFEITGAVVDTERPSVPGSAQVVAIAEDSVDLTWNAATDNIGVAGYRIFNSADNSILAEVPSNSTTLTGLAAGTYTVYLRAFDAAGNVSYRTGNRTFEITGAVVDAERPSVPGSAQIVAIGTDSVDLTWNAATDNVGVTGYRIYDADTNTVVVEVPGTSTTLTGLAAGAYRYYLRAVDAAGNESYRSGTRTVEIIGNADTERPSVPGGVMIDSIVGETVTISWAASTDNVGVAGYRVFDFADGSQIIEVTGTTATFDLPAGTYNVFVKAFDAAGNQGYRNGLRQITTTN